MTPAMVHYGVTEAIRCQRNQVFQVAFETHPERFVHGVPIVPDLPRAVWINPPAEASLTADVAL